MATKSSGAKRDYMPTAAPVGTEVEGRLVDLEGVEGPSALMPKLAPNVPFYLAVHPNQWHVLDGRLIPIVKRLPCMFGIDGADVVNGKLSMATPKANAAAKGYTVIPTSAGPGGASYLKSVDVRGGLHYCTVFETPRAGESVTEFDVAAFEAWVKTLVASGVLPGPSALGLSIAREQLRTQNMKAASKAKVSAEHEDRANRTAEALKVVEDAIAKQRKASPKVREAAPVDLED